MIHLVLENDDNRASLLDPLTDPPQGKYRAQWNDDYHHAWHVLLTGETQGLLSGLCGRPRPPHRARLVFGVRLLRARFPPTVAGRRRGEASGFLSPLAFVNFLQNHDQIGNRPLGDRLATQVDEAPLAAALAVTLLAPMPPLLFMGEEWGATRAVSFLLRFSRAAGGSRPQRSPRGIRGSLCRAGRRHSRSARGGDISLGRARLGGAFDARRAETACARPRPAGDPATGDRAAASRSRVRNGAVRQTRVDGKLVAGRRTFAHLAGQSVEHRRGPPPAIPIGATDLGR